MSPRKRQRTKKNPSTRLREGGESQHAILRLGSADGNAQALIAVWTDALSASTFCFAMQEREGMKPMTIPAMVWREVDQFSALSRL